MARLRAAPPSSDPTNTGGGRFVKSQRRDRINRPVDAEDREDPQSRSPHWPEGDEKRPKYPLQPPVAPLNGKQTISRTCDVCGNHFVLTDAPYYEHMKTYHPWAPRSHKHGVFRPPGQNFNDEWDKIRPDHPSRYNASLPNILSGPPTPEQMTRIQSANRLAQDLGFDVANPDGPPGFSVNEVEKKVMLTMYGLDTFAPADLDPNTFRLGRIIAPTYKDGTPIDYSMIGPDTKSNRRALRSEGLLPPENIFGARSGFKVGSLVLYRNAPGEALPWFRDYDGQDAYIPWRMIQPMHRAFGLPVNIPRGTNKLPIYTVKRGGYVPNNDNHMTFEVRPNDLLRVLDYGRETTEVIDLERRRGEYDPADLSAPNKSLWGFSVGRTWMKNNEQRQLASPPVNYPSLSGSNPNVFRLGRIIAPAPKTPGQQINTADLPEDAQTTDENGNVSYNDYIRLPDPSAKEHGTRWRIGSLVLYLDDEDHPHPRFRDVYGNAKLIPSIQIQKLYRPFDLPENLPLVSENAESGVGLPIIAATRNFTVTNALDFEMLPCRNWEARKNELLLRTDPKKDNANSEAGGDIIEITDYERKSGEVSGEGTWEHVSATPWGVRVDPQVLEMHLRGWVSKAPVPKPSSLTINTPQTGTGTGTGIPLLLSSGFQDYVTEIDQMQTTHTFVTNTAASVKTYIENHVKDLQRKGLLKETQATADWRPEFWTRQANILDRAPLDITLPEDVQAVARLLEISNKLKIGAQASPPSTPKDTPEPKETPTPTEKENPGNNKHEKYFTRAELEKQLSELVQMKKNDGGKSPDYDATVDFSIDYVKEVVRNVFTDPAITTETDAMVAQRKQLWALKSNKPLKSIQGAKPQGVSTRAWSRSRRFNRAFSSDDLKEKNVAFDLPNLTQSKEKSKEKPVSKAPPKDAGTGCAPGFYSMKDFESLINTMSTSLSTARNDPSIPADQNVIQQWQHLSNWAQIQLNLLTSQKIKCETRDMARARPVKWIEHPKFYKSVQETYEQVLSSRDWDNFEILMEIVEDLVWIQPEPLPTKEENVERKEENVERKEENVERKVERKEVKGWKAWLSAFLGGGAAAKAVGVKKNSKTSKGSKKRMRRAKMSGSGSGSGASGKER